MIRSSSLVAGLILALVATAAYACGGGGGRTIAQTGSCGGSCGAPSVGGGGGGGGINPAPVPEFAESTTHNNGSTMIHRAMGSKPAAPARLAMQLPQASPARSSLTTTYNGANTQQMASNRKASEVPYTDVGLSTTTDGKNTRQMTNGRPAQSVPYADQASVTTSTDASGRTQQMASNRAASQLSVEANANKAAPVEVPKPDRVVTRLTFKK
jgi:hypothetical protein